MGKIWWAVIRIFSMATRSLTISTLFEHHKALKVVIVILLLLPFCLLISYWCHSTNSLALTAFAYVTVFNVGSLVLSLLSTWASNQKPTHKFSFGFDRVNVLSVFCITVLLMLFGLNLVKHSLERIFSPPVVSTDRMIIAVIFGVSIHLTISCVVPNVPLQRASECASRNWLQRAMSDCGYSVAAVSPPLGQLLRTKLNPIALLVVGGAASVIMTQILIDLDELYIADVMGALFISGLVFSTMVPLSRSTAKILLQTAPHKVLPLLDKTLREASTLDGVLGIKNEHFWSITYGVYVGSLDVRVRRQANEQEVLMQLTSRLASHMSDLTVQVIKEDWSLPSGPAMTTPSSTPIGHLSPNVPSVPLPHRHSYDLQTAKFSSPSSESSSSRHNVGGLTMTPGGGSGGGGQVGHYSLNPRLQQSSHFTQQL